jgi:hypothetical protein
LKKFFSKIHVKCGAKKLVGKLGNVKLFLFEDEREREDEGGESRRELKF